MTDKPEKPVDPGPCCGDRERREYAEANAAWSTWILDHPEDDVLQDQPRGDGTSPRVKRSPPPPPPGGPS